VQGSAHRPGPDDGTIRLDRVAHIGMRRIPGSSSQGKWHGRRELGLNADQAFHELGHAAG
jgi:hypothetical protein